MKHFCEQHTHTDVFYCVFCQTVENKNPQWDFQSPAKQRSENKKTKKSREFHMILMYTMLFICKAVYLSIV